MRSSFGNIGIAQRRKPGAQPRGIYPREQPITSGEYFAPIELSDTVKRFLEPVEYDGVSPLKGRLNRVVNWDRMTMEQRVAFIRLFTEDTARDPAIAQKAIEIIRAAHVPLRDHEGEWAALLKYVQTTCRFTAEPGERLASVQHTLSVKFGDCDDLAIALASLAHSIRLPFKFCLSGRNRKGEKIRWIEGVGSCPRGVAWSHIFLLAGWPSFTPKTWAFAEPTLDVRLGWDLLTETIPKGRTDLAGLSPLRGPLGSVSSGNLPSPRAKESPLQVVKRHAGKINWYTVATYALGGLASALLVKSVIGGKAKE